MPSCKGNHRPLETGLHEIIFGTLSLPTAKIGKCAVFLKHMRAIHYFFLLISFGVLITSCGMGKIKKGIVLVDAGHARSVPTSSGLEAENRHAEADFVRTIMGEDAFQGIRISIPNHEEPPIVYIQTLQPVLFLSIVFPYLEHDEPGYIRVISGKDRKSRKAAEKLKMELRSYELLHVATEVDPNIELLNLAPGIAITLEIGNFTNEDQAQQLKNPESMRPIIEIIQQFIRQYAEEP